MRVKRLLALVFVISLLTCVLPGFALAEIFWERTFGGPGMDGLGLGQQTTDGGFILGGYTESFGPTACYLVKTDINGNEEWSPVFFGNGYYASCPYAQQTSDGGFITSGFTLGGSGGVYLVKTDANGNEVWSRILEGWGLRGEQTSDGGYIFTGSTSPWGVGSTLLVKTDPDGIEQWRNTFEGGGWYGEAVHQTADGGYIIHGPGLIKTDANGNMMWWKTDLPGNAKQTADGGYIIGFTGTNLTKTDSFGDVLWSKWLGGDWGGDVSQTSDGGYIVTGGIDRGFLLDFLLIKTDANGNKEWEKSWGGSDFDLAYRVQQTRSGGYVIAGQTLSFGAGSWDGYLSYYNPSPDNLPPSLDPVANKTFLWPPNHKMVDINIVANASDNSGGPVTLAAAVSSNEPEDGLGDGDTAPDWTEPVIDQANGIINLQLRAERSGSGSGRVYTITITATDASGNSSQANVQIIVPHDKSKK